MKKRVITVGIIGLGRAGWGMHCKELDERKDKFRVVAACDLIKKRRDKIVECYGGRPYRNAEDLINDPEVELVDVASRTTEHVAHATMALRAGKMVFLEKPIGISYREAKKLEKVALRYPGKLFIRHNRRFEGCFQKIMEIVQSGTIGDLYQVKLRRQAYNRRDDWQVLMKSGGGQLLNWGPHLIDQALQFLGSPVSSLWRDLRRVAAAGDAEDSVKILMRAENGRVADIEIGGGAALSEPIYAIFGSKGTIIAEKGDKFKLRYLDPEYKLPRRRAKISTPELGSFGSKDDLKWIEEEVEVDDSVTPSHIWDHLYASICDKKAFPIALQQAMDVMKVVSASRKGTTFEPAAAR